jgi:hypothetical protein
MRRPLGDQGVDVFGIVVWSLVFGAAAGEVEAFAQAGGRLASVGLAGDVERHQIQELGQAGTVGEGADSVPDPPVELDVDELLDGARGVRGDRVAGRGLRLDASAVCLKPGDRERECPVLTGGMLGLDRPPEHVPGLRTVRRVEQGAADRVTRIGEDLLGEALAELAPEVPFAQALVPVGVGEHVLDRGGDRVIGVADERAGRGFYVFAAMGWDPGEPGRWAPVPRLWRFEPFPGKDQAAWETFVGALQAPRVIAPVLIR